MTIRTPIYTCNEVTYEARQEALDRVAEDVNKHLGTTLTRNDFYYANFSWLVAIRVTLVLGQPHIYMASIAGTLGDEGKPIKNLEYGTVTLTIPGVTGAYLQQYTPKHAPVHDLLPNESWVAFADRLSETRREDVYRWFVAKRHDMVFL
jgi:hypothetical protein